VCDGAPLAVISEAALLRLAQPLELRTLPRLDEATRAELLSACACLLCSAVNLSNEDDGAATEAPVIVALLQVLHSANVVYGERDLVASELQSDDSAARLVKALQHGDARVVAAAARVLSDLACTGGDAETDTALLRLRRVERARTRGRSSCN
jgi:hypothetical protein